MTRLARFLGFRARGGNEPAADSPQEVRRAVTLCHSLLTERGEVSGAKIAAEILALYSVMNRPSRAALFDALATGFSPDPDAVGLAGAAYSQEPSPRNLSRLQAVVEPPRQELFRRLNSAPGATAILVGLRSEVLCEIARKPEWQPIADDLGHLFASWFNRGFLMLERIDWQSSAAVLEKLIRYEAVHAIQGFPDLRRRLAADRSCYAFFHPAMPQEPIIFVEIALTRGMSAKVQPLLDPDAPVLDPESADAATFYSITNCHEGLKGVPFGSFLIKQVAADLGQKFPKLRRFATLSPVPGFAAWLKSQPRYAELAANLAQPAWVSNQTLSAEYERTLPALCAYYLLRGGKGKEPRDGVARFHLRNGARLERINWLGDVSEAGLRGSFGMMVNYVYRLAEIESNHERYTHQYKIAASAQVEVLAKRVERTLPVLELG